ncbi:MAG: geranylgeranylglyceryl/heptaprenylglyceryl phosphate synthase [Thermoplasmata archaeon]|nr:MAG: geranylgeranylglyceryl/heptaprenylglyceryl phosphate synthase [Thermoplasmata archaeon]HEC89077.1 geranylgeranylglyceryl/heptaprenylglyceryl phosphate synthase [Thermoplasmatales archaeon]
MNLTDYILQKLEEKKLHFSLIDPDKQSADDAGVLAKTVEEAGSSAIMVGGSTIASSKQVDETILAIKAQSTLPVILFPSSAEHLSKYADGIFFMSLLNSRDVDYVIREHVKGAFFVRDTGIQPLPMGYLIVEPGMTVGRVGKVDPVKRNDIKTAVGFALAAKYLGMKFFYLEAGSGAPKPVPNEMISAVKENVDLPLLVGGGIRDAKTARGKAKAGADIIVTGTALEKNKENLKDYLKTIIEAIEGV